MDTVVFIPSNAIGDGGAKLGTVLMNNFLYSLARTDEKPDAVVFMNSGVRLACEGSEALESLGLLVEDGVRVYSCGTCLDYYGLKDALAVGDVGTMNDTVAMFMEADNVVTVG